MTPTSKTDPLPATDSPTAASYLAFAEFEASGISPLYSALCAGVSADPELVAFLDEQPQRCRQPHLLLAVVRYAFGLQETYPAFRAAVLGDRALVARLLNERFTQTNEAARCAAILPILAALPGPLALLEVGASAGLCLQPDRYAYRYGDAEVPGRRPDAPVFACRPLGPVAPPVPAAVPEVVWRRGIDLAPVDVTDDDAVRWLQTLIWPGQDTRERTLREAVAVARHDPPVVVTGDLGELVEEVAAQAPADATLVVFHTAVLEYVAPDARRAFADRVEALDAAWIAGELPGVLDGSRWPGEPMERRHFVVTVGGALKAEAPVARMSVHGDWIEWGEMTPRYAPRRP